VVLMNKGRVEQAGAPDEVYNQPASPFVYGFLGNVNLFQGRVHEGVLEAGSIALDAPDHAQANDAKGVGFVRPHDIEIERYTEDAEGIVATLRRAHAIGPLARLELECAGNARPIEAEMSRERYVQLHLAEGERLVLRPKRLRVFVDNTA